MWVACTAGEYLFDVYQYSAAVSVRIISASVQESGSKS